MNTQKLCAACSHANDDSGCDPWHCGVEGKDWAPRPREISGNLVCPDYHIAVVDGLKAELETVRSARTSAELQAAWRAHNAGLR